MEVSRGPAGGGDITVYSVASSLSIDFLPNIPTQPSNSSDLPCPTRTLLKNNKYEVMSRHSVWLEGAERRYRKPSRALKHLPSLYPPET